MMCVQSERSSDRERSSSEQGSTPALLRACFVDNNVCPLLATAAVHLVLSLMLQLLGDGARAAKLFHPWRERAVAVCMHVSIQQWHSVEPNNRSNQRWIYDA